jgi:hypothetical protein
MFFLCVSLGSSTVQRHDSRGSTRACACSEAGLSSHQSKDFYAAGFDALVKR